MILIQLHYRLNLRINTHLLQQICQALLLNYVLCPLLLHRPYRWLRGEVLKLTEGSHEGRVVLGCLLKVYAFLDLPVSCVETVDAFFDLPVSCVELHTTHLTILNNLVVARQLWGVHQGI